MSCRLLKISRIPTFCSNATQVRRDAFEALRKLLGHISALSPVVIAIDDLQWGDLDSLAFLAELTLPLSAPSVMLLLSFRSEDAASSLPIGVVRTFKSSLVEASAWTEIPVSGLSEEEGRDLLELLQKSGPRTTKERASDILQESGGSPLLLIELLRFSSSKGNAEDSGKPAATLLVSEMIRHRAANLALSARQLLEP